MSPATRPRPHFVKIHAMQIAGRELWDITTYEHLPVEGLEGIEDECLADSIVAALNHIWEIRPHRARGPRLFDAAR